MYAQIWLVGNFNHESWLADNLNHESWSIFIGW